MATRKLGFTPLRNAFLSRLTTNALTSAYRVYGFAPRTAAMPYVTFGTPMGVQSSKFTTADSEAEENVITVHVWSDYLGDKECSDMMDNIVQAILGTALAITAYYTPPLARLDYSEIIVDDTDPNRLVRHGILRFLFHMIPS